MRCAETAAAAARLSAGKRRLARPLTAGALWVAARVRQRGARLSSCERVCYWTVRVRASVLRKGKLSDALGTLAHTDRPPPRHVRATSRRTRSRRPSGHRELIDTHSTHTAALPLRASPRLSAPLRASPRLSAPRLAQALEGTTSDSGGSLCTRSWRALGGRAACGAHAAGVRAAGGSGTRCWQRACA